MKTNLFFSNITVQSAFGVLCLSVTLLSFPKQTVLMSSAKDLVWDGVSLGRLNASQTKILGLGKVRISNKKCKVFNHETSYTGKTIGPTSVGK